MRKLIIIFFALVLVACSGAPAATQTQPPQAVAPEPSQTAVVVIITATSAPTDVPPLPTYTALPTYTMPPAPTEAPTQQPAAPAATEAVAAPPTEAPAANTGGVVTLDDKLGKGWFVSMTRDRNDFSLRCQLNKTITFTAKATSPDIKSVDFWYRLEDRSTGAIFEWVNFGKMVPDNEGNYKVTLSGDQLNPNFRKPNSWFDYQFVGYNPTGVLGRSEKIERQVSYTFDCP